MSGQKTPTKVAAISSVKEVACGVAHTLALSTDGLTVWSFGSGDSGKLGHGDTNKLTSPKVCMSIVYSVDCVHLIYMYTVYTYMKVLSEQRISTESACVYVYKSLFDQTLALLAIAYTMYFCPSGN